MMIMMTISAKKDGEYNHAINNYDDDDDDDRYNSDHSL